MNRDEAGLGSPSVSTPSIRNDEEFVVVGSCSGSTVIPKGEVEAFHRGSRDFIVWGLVATVLLVSVAVLLA